MRKSGCTSLKMALTFSPFSLMSTGFKVGEVKFFPVDHNLKTIAN